MSSSIATGPPYMLVAGDNLKFSVNNPSYPGGVWTMQFVMIFPDFTPQIFTGAAQGDGSFLVTVNPANTDTVLPEEYATAYVFSNTATNQRQTEYGPTVWVTPDPTKPIQPTANQMALSSFEEARLKLSRGTNQIVEVNGQKYTRKDLKQIQDQISLLGVAVKRELDQLKTLMGQHTDGVVHATFCPSDGGFGGQGHNGGFNRGCQ